MSSYQAIVTREGRWWVAEVEQVGVATQARRLTEVRERVVDLIATAIDGESDEIDVELTLIIPADVEVELEHAKRLRVEAARAQSEAAEAVRHAARTLAGTGMTLRDIGEVLDVSYQRAHQLVRGPGN